VRGYVFEMGKRGKNENKVENKNKKGLMEVEVYERIFWMINGIMKENYLV
jgi:hypothetical protein